MFPLPDCRTLVLAAGRGTRMGVPKAIMPVGNLPWCQHQRVRLERSGVPATWVVSPEIFSALMRNPEAINGLGRPIISDGHLPMFQSLLAGIAAVWEGPGKHERGGLFVLPVDVPAPMPKVWKALAASDRLSVPTFEGRGGHPVFLPWRWVERIVAAGTAPDAEKNPPRLDKLIGADAAKVPVDDPDVCVNLNTPGDVQAWLDTHGGGGPEGRSA